MQQRIVVRLALALRKARGACGRPGYDLTRHIKLLRAYREERARLSENYAMQSRSVR